MFQTNSNIITENDLDIFFDKDVSLNYLHDHFLATLLSHLYTQKEFKLSRESAFRTIVERSCTL